MDDISQKEKLVISFLTQSSMMNNMYQNLPETSKDPRTIELLNLAEQKEYDTAQKYLGNKITMGESNNNQTIESLEGDEEDDVESEFEINNIFIDDEAYKGKFDGGIFVGEDFGFRTSSPFESIDDDFDMDMRDIFQGEKTDLDLSSKTLGPGLIVKRLGLANNFVQGLGPNQYNVFCAHDIVLNPGKIVNVLPLYSCKLTSKETTVNMEFIVSYELASRLNVVVNRSSVVSYYDYVPFTVDIVNVSKQVVRLNSWTVVASVMFSAHIPITIYDADDT